MPLSNPGSETRHPPRSPEIHLMGAGRLNHKWRTSNPVLGTECRGHPTLGSWAAIGSATYSIGNQGSSRTRGDPSWMLPAAGVGFVWPAYASDARREGLGSRRIGQYWERLLVCMASAGWAGPLAKRSRLSVRPHRGPDRAYRRRGAGQFVPGKMTRRVEATRRASLWLMTARWHRC